jgi:hypothetical protein
MAIEHSALTIFTVSENTIGPIFFFKYEIVYAEAGSRLSAS